MTLSRVLALMVAGACAAGCGGNAKEPPPAGPKGSAPRVLSADEADRIASGGVGQAAQSAPAQPTPAQPAQPAAQSLQVARVADAAAGLDPGAAAWAGVKGLQVPLLPQQITMPRLMTASVTALEVQAMADRTRIAFRVQWADATKDELVEQSRFGDGVALQFPLDDDAAFTMGHAEGRVHILNWKAQWQRDVDRGFTDVEDLRPNTWSDLYWFVQGERPYRVPDSFRDERAHAWFPAKAAGNAVAQWDRKQPVEELVAAGFGTSTNRKQGTTSARGVWQAGRWTVTFLRPLQTGAPLDYPFDGSKQELIGFAVWDGSAENVGGRKHYSLWVPFTLQAQ
jgi:hypothetical protein